MEIETPAALAGDELRRLLAATISPDKAAVDAAAAGLDRAAADPRFPLAILAVAAGTPFLPPATACGSSCALTAALVPCDFAKACAFYCPLGFRNCAHGQAASKCTSPVSL
jgi:hypothetical protein